MKTYKVRVLQSAEADIEALADFLLENLSREGAYRYRAMVPPAVPQWPSPVGV